MRNLPQVVVTLLASCVAAAAVAQTPSPDLRWGPARVAIAGGDSMTVDTATLSVPEWHRAPNGRQITLPVVRLASKAAVPGAPLLYLAGGPGASGVNELRNGDRAPLFVALSAISDVILIDQRGTGRSRPSLVLPGRLDLPSDKPINDPEVLRGLASRIATAVSALKASGVDLDAYNTVESALDMEQLRLALHVQRISLWGHSYGSHLALAMLKARGETLERVIIGGVNGLDQRWRLPSDGDSWLARMDSTIKARSPGSAAAPSLLRDLRALLGKLERAPLHAQVDGHDVLVGRDELATLIALTAGDNTLVTRLPEIISQINAGNVSPVATQVQQTLRDRPLGTAMTYAMHIASGVNAAREARIAKEARTALLRNAINYPFNSPAVSRAFGMTPLGEAFRQPVASNVPVLLMSGSLDGRTSITDAEQVRQKLGNSRHIIIDGAGHNFYTTTPRVLEQMLAFLRGEAVVSSHIQLPNAGPRD